MIIFKVILAIVVIVAIILITKMIKDMVEYERMKDKYY